MTAARVEVGSATSKFVPFLLAGLHRALADRVPDLQGRVPMQQEAVVTGGVAMNRAVVREIETRLGLTVCVAPQPQIMGALGAALVAGDGSGG